MATPNKIQPSPLSYGITGAGAKTTTEALPLEILYNLKYQHKWTDLCLHQISAAQTPPLLDLTNEQSSTTFSIPAGEETRIIISGLPPKHSYIHPDFLNHLVLHKIAESDVSIQREWVLPMSLGETWTLKRISAVFDALPERETRQGFQEYKHQDGKRVLLGMLSHNGMGGDGTVVYYIMQEGEVKPRQN